jgi:hypothetical protein
MGGTWLLWAVRARPAFGAPRRPIRALQSVYGLYRIRAGRPLCCRSPCAARKAADGKANSQEEGKETERACDRLRFLCCVPGSDGNGGAAGAGVIIGTHFAGLFERMPRLSARSEPIDPVPPAGAVPGRASWRS